jgi:pyruvate/2-oxoglutarate dehydrogenase complex dihydrolipoamide dehydrogenase (E3) component
VEGLNLEAAGVQCDQDGIIVNSRLQTSNPRVFAAGDVCSKYKFTHAADAMARIVIANALFRGWQKASALVIPWCTYTDPELAHVGLYEKEARGQGLNVQTFTWKLDEVDRAVLDGEESGFARVLVRKGTDKILGATIVAAHAGDMISEITLAMTNRLGLGDVVRTIHPYPTQAEAVKKLGDAYNRTRVTPFVKKILEKWLSRSRRG